MRKLAFCIALLCAGMMLPMAGHARTLSTAVIGMFPQNIGEFAYADLREARTLSWFPQIKEQMLPARFQTFERFLAAAGIDPNSQIEELAWALVPMGLPGSDSEAAASAVPTSERVVGIALGSFQPETAEAFFRAQDLPTAQVRNHTLYAFGSGSGANDLFFFFLDANTAAFGQRNELEKLIAVRYGEEQSVLTNEDLGPLITQANGSGVVWAVLSAPYTRLAMRQLTPETAKFPQAEQLVAKLRALTIEIDAGSGVDARFEAVCATPDDANTFAALLQAGLLYRRYQIGNSNPELASMLDQARVAPSGDRLNIRLLLTDEQVVSLIERRTFSIRT